MENTEIRNELQTLITEAHAASADVGIIIEESLKDVFATPFEVDEILELLNKVIQVIELKSQSRGDIAVSEDLSTNYKEIIDRVLTTKDRIDSINRTNSLRLNLIEHNAINPGQVKPTPTFHRREIPMNCGYVKTTDIKLWQRNERLDIHLGQFEANYGRKPSAEELLDIMLSKMPLPGLSGDDEFKIKELARSIANNGVRKPPIIDIDGTLLDGNRRVAACYYILNSDEFDTDQKKKANNIYVWQLTEYANNDDRNAVVVSLNFEPDCYVAWPEYVKADIIYKEWQTMLAQEMRNPGRERMNELKRQLAKNFGYGEDTYFVDRYIKMIGWTSEFEDYLVNEKKNDAFEVKHQTDKYFQYFDELSKGTRAGGVAYTLNQNEPFKHLVFELLFQGKFKNWTLIRNLRYYNQDIHEALMKAREMNEVEEAEDLIEDKLNEAKANQRESRIGNPNQRISIFTRWLENLPISAFRDDIKKENLLQLLEALKLVEHQIKDIDSSHSEVINEAV